MIELYTYRAGSHSTSDDPSKYRPKDEWDYWPLGDPNERLKQHLFGLGEWTEPQHQKLIAELNTHVQTAWNEAVSHGTLNEGPWPPVNAMFEDIYKELPVHLRKQRSEMER